MSTSCDPIFVPSQESKYKAIIQYQRGSNNSYNVILLRNTDRNQRCTEPSVKLMNGDFDTRIRSCTSHRIHDQIHMLIKENHIKESIKLTMHLPGRNWNDQWLDASSLFILVSLFRKTFTFLSKSNGPRKEYNLIKQKFKLSSFPAHC